MICLSSDTGLPESTPRYINGTPFTVTEPQGEIKGITFLISAANLPLTSYRSIRRTLRHVGQVVVDYNYNIFASHSRNHTKLVSTIREAFLSLKNDYTEVEKFGVIGHAIGGKIALMVAAMTEHDDSALEFVLALDPIDKSPVQIANGSLNFGKCKFPIFVTNTGCVTNNGALDIYSRHMNSIKVLHHTGAGHLAYCDGAEELSHWNYRLGKGTNERNVVIKRRAIKTIKTSFRWESQDSLDAQEAMDYRKSMQRSIINMNTSQISLDCKDLDSSVESGSFSEPKDSEEKVNETDPSSPTEKLESLDTAKTNELSIAESGQPNNESMKSAEAEEKKSKVRFSQDKKEGQGRGKLKKNKSFKGGMKKTGKVMWTVLKPT